jgi:hypothetical protein
VSASGAPKSAEPFAAVIKPFESNESSKRDGFVGFQPMSEVTEALELTAATEVLPAVIARDSPADGTLSVHVGAKVGVNLVIALSIFFPTFT